MHVFIRKSHACKLKLSGEFRGSVVAAAWQGPIENDIFNERYLLYEK